MENREKNKPFMDRIPVPACIVDKEGNIKAANTRMKEVFAYEGIVDSSFFVLAGVKRKDLIAAACDPEQPEISIRRNSQIFVLRTNTDPCEEEDLLVYFINVSERESLKAAYRSEHICLLYINIDNYDELISSITTDSRRAVPTEVDRIVRAWAGRFDAVIEATSDETYMMTVFRRDAEKIIEERFSVLDEVRMIETKIDFPVSLSIGMGMGAETLRETTELAEASLELAMGRGGDQAVVKNGDRTSYYGGKLQSFEKNNKGKSRVIAHALKQLVLDSDRVLIMGHRWPDMDSFGAAIGAYKICRYFERDAYIIIEEFNEALQVVYKQAKETEEYEIINREKAIGLCNERTLVIVVDTNRPGMVECPEILKISDRLVMIDHHRLAEDSIDNPILSYVESYASSASELMAEIIQYTATRRIINKFEAEALLAGITVDTNSYSIRTGVRTFEAAAWLRRAGADTTEVKRFFQSEATSFQVKADAIAGAEYLDNGIVIATSRGYSTEAQIINAQVADELLMVKGVEASFALGKNDRHMTVISARSLGNINVQMIMEQFNGGGHLTSAGAQVNLPPEEVIKRLKTILTDLK
ncbi:MAG: DHH family phosphoesterase [Mogibacterium sp.]|nr:DHH family phosphoesterase [Mogibacterium sp.]